MKDTGQVREKRVESVERDSKIRFTSMNKNARKKDGNLPGSVAPDFSNVSVVQRLQRLFIMKVKTHTWPRKRES